MFHQSSSLVSSSLTLSSNGSPIIIIFGVAVKFSTSGLTNVMWGHRRPVACFPFLRDVGDGDDHFGDHDNDYLGDHNNDYDDEGDGADETCQEQWIVDQPCLSLLPRSLLLRMRGRPPDHHFDH